VHIIREVMDESVFERRESIGMRLTMVRRLPEAGGRESPTLEETKSEPTNSKKSGGNGCGHCGNTNG
jgi:hypothetical protein